MNRLRRSSTLSGNQRRRLTADSHAPSAACEWSGSLPTCVCLHKVNKTHHSKSGTPISGSHWPQACKKIAAEVSLDLHYRTLRGEMTEEEKEKKNQFIVLLWLKPDFLNKKNKTGKVQYQHTETGFITTNCSRVAQLDSNRFPTAVVPYWHTESRPIKLPALA